jgi:hypothetical protein
MQMEGWYDISTAPRDGTLVRVGWADDGVMREWFVMKWNPFQLNGLFPGDKGMWVAPDGSFTWNEVDPEGAPTHWGHYVQ